MRCIICSNPNRLEIDREIVRTGNIARIAKSFGVSYASLYSHSINHVARQLTTAMELKAKENNYDMLDRIENIVKNAEIIFQRNFEKGADVTALKALDSQRATFELLCKISVALHSAKVAEMELNKSDSHDEEELEFQESLKVLSFEELELFAKLMEKIESQDKSIKILPKSSEVAAFTSILPIKQGNTIAEDEIEATNPFTMVRKNKPKIGSIPPEQIPSSKWRDNPLNPMYHREKDKQRQRNMDDNDSFNEMESFKRSLRK